MPKGRTLLLFAAGLVLAVGATAQANLIQDASFSSGGAGSPWTGVNRWHDYHYNTAPYSARIGYSLDTPIYQTIGMNVLAGTYDVALCQDGDGPAGNITFDIGYGTGDTFVPVAGVLLPITTTGGHYGSPAWDRVTDSIVITPAQAVDQPLTVRIFSTPDVEFMVYVDDVEMTYIPEPATLATLAVGACLSVVCRRRSSRLRV